jgi:hypothetical protein
MNPNAPQAVVRALLAEADHLSRLSFAEHEETLSTRFAALRTECSYLERCFGASPPRLATARDVDQLYRHVLDVAASSVGHGPRGLVDKLVRIAQRLRAPQPRTLMGFPRVRS